MKNSGPGEAFFADGQTIFRDNLPADATYGPPTVGNIKVISNSANIHCGIAANVLTCTASGATVGLGKLAGAFDVVFTVTPSLAGVLLNPSGGVCQADPDNVVAEWPEVNDECPLDYIFVNYPVPSRQMYVANSGNRSVVRANLDGSGSVLLGNIYYDAYFPILGVGVDPAARKLYASSYAWPNHSLVWTNLDGSQGTLVGGFPLGGYHIAVDAANNKVYMLSYYSVGRVNLDGTGYTDLEVNTKDSQSGGIALDPQNGKMYITFCDNRGDYAHITTANLDGAGGVSIGNLDGLLLGAGSGPGGIALDVANNKLYVANGSTILRADLDGTAVTSLGNLNGTLNGAKSIALDLADGKMYVVNGGNSTISVANLDGSGGVSLGNLNGRLNQPTDIVLDLSQPDVTVRAANDAGGSVTAGSSFDWLVTVQNTSTIPSLFSNGQVIFRSNLPAGPAYGAPALQDVSGVYVGAHINCGIAANILTCTANSGPVTLDTTTGQFVIKFMVTPNVVGPLALPAGGVCRVDPDNVVSESNESNNDCSDVVAVNPAPAPTIIDFTPASGRAGTRVTVVGTNFSGATAVTFNGASAVYGVVSPTQITAAVPLFATSGPIRITTPGGMATSNDSFTVTSAGYLPLIRR